MTELTPASMTLLVDRVTVEVVRAFDAAGIVSILLKGPTFAAALYPSGGRLYGDTDLIVSSDDLAAAATVLRGLGFENRSAGLALSEHTSTHEFVREWTVVDLHWSLDPGANAATTWRELWAESEPMHLGPIQVRALTTVGRAMHVALHAAQHGLLGPQPRSAGGRTGEDLRRALDTWSDSVWRDAAALAERIGSLDAFAFGLRMTDAGAAVADRLGLGDLRPELWRFGGTGDVPRGAQRLARLRGATTWSQKATVAARGVFPSRVHARNRATTKRARRWLPAAYVEYWWRALRGLRDATRFGRR